MKHKNKLYADAEPPKRAGELGMSQEERLAIIKAKVAERRHNTKD